MIIKNASDVVVGDIAYFHGTAHVATAVKVYADKPGVMITWKVAGTYSAQLYRKFSTIEVDGQ